MEATGTTPTPAARDGAEFAVAIVGAGFSGIAMGVLLKKAGIESFVVLEKGDDVGGTWRENTYPGAACDIPSHLYSFSFEPKADWSRAYSPQAEILEYLRHCADKYALRPHIRFGTKVAGATFDPARGVWHVRTADGATLTARALVLGNGALHLPALPDIPGRDTFAGRAFHSAQWDHGYDLRGKKVAVIGTGASSIQFVPRVAPRVEQLTVFQRTPPWIVPKPDRAMSPREHARFARFPALHRAFRAAIYLRQEAVLLSSKSPRMVKVLEAVARKHLAASVADPALRAKLLPDYRMGCKRILISNDYYPALARPNVALVTEGIAEITPRGVVTRDGREHAVDAILYGTGFSVTHYLAPLSIAGRDGQDLNATFGRKPEAFLGINVAGFPNLFLLMGPNTGLGHNSMIFMIEAQARYAVQCVRALLEQGIAALDVREDVQSRFNAALQEELKRSVWMTGCRSWYIDENGRNTTIWPGFTWDYWRRTRRVDLANYART